MKRTDSETAGGSDFSFEVQESNIEETSGERLRNLYEEFVYKPALVAWDDWRTRIGGFILATYLFVATFGVVLYPDPGSREWDLPPGQGIDPFQTWAAPLGVTPNGADVLGSAIHATPNMLLMVMSGAVWATGLAIVIGTVAGYKGGLADKVIMTFSDVMMAIPGLPMVMVVAFLYNPKNPLVIGIVVMINYWAGLARSIRSEVLSLREESYVEASRAMGVSTPRIIFKDILPGLMPFVLVNFAFAARYVVFASVGLYYLGVLPTDLANWGYQLDKAYNTYNAMVGSGATYLIIVPMIFIGLLGLSMVLLAQGLDRLFNPRVRTRLAGESESIEEEEDSQTVSGGI